MSFRVISGTVDAAGTEERVSSTDPTLCSQAWIQNTHATSLLYVGPSTVSATVGLTLIPGEKLPIGPGGYSNLYELYVDTNVNGCTFQVLYSAN